jgi:hypothetical protein
MDINLITGNRFQRRKAANVIGMSVGQDNMADISGLLAQRVQGPHDGTYAARNSGVNQGAAIGRIQKKGIHRADRNDIESIRDLCYLYSALKTPRKRCASYYLRLHCMTGKKGSWTNGRSEPNDHTIENAGVKKGCCQRP